MLDCADLIGAPRDDHADDGVPDSFRSGEGRARYHESPILSSSGLCWLCSQDWDGYHNLSWGSKGPLGMDCLGTEGQGDGQSDSSWEFCQRG